MLAVRAGGVALNGGLSAVALDEGGKAICEGSGSLDEEEIALIKVEGMLDSTAMAGDLLRLIEISLESLRYSK